MLFSYINIDEILSSDIHIIHSKILPSYFKPETSDQSDRETCALQCHYL
jgi:hypothetical protein